MSIDLPFEQPLAELKAKIAELKSFGDEKKIDFSDEIAKLEQRYQKLEDELYTSLSAAQIMQIARHPSRPKTLDYIQAIFSDFMELHGDRHFGDDLAIVGGIAKLNDIPVTVVGHQKGKDTKDNLARHFGMAHPEGFRKALRLMKQAEKFKRPIITFIDTPGAYSGDTAEERGVAEAVARNLMEMSAFTVPVVCVVIGEGGSGGALALGVGNRVLMLENSIYSVISPNSAAAILWKDASQADRAAEAMKITSKDMLELGIVEEAIPEPKGGAHRDFPSQAEKVKDAISRHLQELLQLDGEALAQDRMNRFRKIGSFSFIKENL